MLDIHFIREHAEEVKEGLRKKQVTGVDVDAVLVVDAEQRKVLAHVESLRAEMNALSDSIAQAKAQKNEDSAAKLLQEAESKKEKLRELEPKEAALRRELRALFLQMPNLPSADVPEGKDERDNMVLREAGEKPRFSFVPKDYLALAEPFDLIDMERGAKVAGSRFAYLKREAVLLEFALVQHAYALLVKEGFVPVIPPVMIRPEMYRGMGRLAAGQEEERYYLPKDELYLAGSAEHTIGPMHSGEILEENDLPKRYLGFSTCFRREAGSYGKDTKGILRVHQFDKIEMFSFAKPEASPEEHTLLLSMQEKLMQSLDLPYRVVEICTGDMGWTDAKQYDIETWLPGQNGGKGEYRETHSCSNTTDFQARGVNIRFRRHAMGDRPHVEYVHMLNATAFAVGRMLIAIFENYQQEDGSILVPEALRPYCGFSKIPAEKERTGS